MSMDTNNTRYSYSYASPHGRRYNHQNDDYDFDDEDLSLFLWNQVMPDVARGGGGRVRNFHHRQTQMEDDDDDDDDASNIHHRFLPPPPPPPSPDTMARRRAFRRGIVEETLQHRRLEGQEQQRQQQQHYQQHQQHHQEEEDFGDDDDVDTHNSTTSSMIQDESNDGRNHPNSMSRADLDCSYIGRNVCAILRDREQYGSPHLIVQKSFSTTANNNNEKDNAITTTNTNEPQPQSKSSSSRSMTYPMQIARELQNFAEFASVTKFQSTYLHHLGGNRTRTSQDNAEQDLNRTAPTSSAAVSTISIAFSPDSQTMASTHGDHTVKITSCITGDLLQTLEGHPRTPWTVKYHPTNSDILASGCLGCQVRVWDWKSTYNATGTCLHMIRLDHAIISLSFHPSGHILAVASGSKLHFWDYDNFGARAASATTGSAASTILTSSTIRDDQQQQGGNRNNSSHSNRGGRGALTEVEQRHMLRCVHFPPNGTTLIVGGTNPQTDEQRRRGRSGMSGGGMTFYLKLWDFDLEAALHPDDGDARDVRNLSRTVVRVQQRKALSNARMFVPRALLYNDGGFDVSPDGLTLCCCAEYWLPYRVDSAVELLQREEMVDESMDTHEIQTNDDDAAQDASFNSNQVLSPRRQGSSSEQGGNFESPNRQAVSTPVNSPPRRPMNGPQQRNRESLPMTPPNPSRLQLPLSPPPPPGVRFNNLNNVPQRLPTLNDANRQSAAEDGNPLMFSAPTASSRYQPPQRAPHPLSIVSGSLEFPDVAQQPGRYVPHVVTVSLDTSPIAGDSVPSQYRSSVARGHRPRLGQLLEAAPLDGSKAAAVTCVKFSPSADFCLLGYGVREPVDDDNHHPVTALYRVRGGMKHVSTMLSGDDDVNIARFHPDSGYGFVYGTKQGKVRVLSPRPWNYYNC